MIVNTVFFDDSEYLIEDTGAVTRFLPDGSGIYTDLDETAAVLDAQNAADSGEIAEVA